MHTLGKWLGSAALAIASVAFLLGLIISPLISARVVKSPNSDQPPMKSGIRTTRTSTSKRLVKVCSMLICIVFAAAALTLVANDLHILHPSALKRPPAMGGAQQRASGAPTPAGVRSRRVREVVLDIDRNWDEADPSGLGVVNGPPVSPPETGREFDSSASRDTLNRDTRAAEKWDQLQMWAFTSSGRLLSDSLSTPGPISVLSVRSAIPLPVRAPNSNLYPFLQSSRPTSTSVFSSQNIDFEPEPSIAAAICVIGSHLTLISALVVLARLTCGLMTGSGETQSQSEDQLTTQSKRALTKSARLLLASFALLLIGFVALRTTALLLRSAAYWSKSLPLNDLLALAVAVGWLVICVAHVVGRCFCLRIHTSTFPRDSSEKMTEVSSPDATDGNQTEALTKRENPPSSQQPIATTCPQNVSVEGRENVDPHKKSKWQRVSGLLRHSSSGIASRDGRFKRSEAIDDVDLNVGVAPNRSADRTTEKSSSPEEATVREEQPEVAPKSEKNAAPGDIQSKASQGESKPPKKKMVTAPTLKGEPHQLASTTKTPQAKTAAASKSTTATSIAQNKEEQKSSSTTKSRIQKDKNAKDELLKEAAPSSKRPKKVTLDPKRPDLKSSTQQLQVGPASVSVAEEQNRRDSSRPENNTMETRNKQGSAAAASVRQEAQTAQSQGDSGAIGAAHSKKSAGHTTTAGAVENSLVAQRIRNSGQPLDTSAPKREPVHAEAGGGGVVPSSSGKQTATTHYIKHCDSAHGGGKYTADGQQSGHADADKFKHSDSSHSLRGKHAESGGAAATAITKHKEKEEKQKGKYKEERHKDGSGGGPLVNTDCGHSRSSRAGTSNNAASAAEGENGRVRGPGFMFEQTRSSRDETTIRSQDSGGSPDAADGDVSDNVFAALPVPNPHKHPCAYPKSHFKSLDRERQHTASRLAALNAAPPVVVPPLPPFVPRSKTKAKKKRLQRGDGVDQDGDEEETSAEEDDMRAVRPTDLAVPKMVVDHEDDTLGWRKRKLVGPLRQKEELLGHVAEELSKHPTGCAHTPHYLRSRSEELETPNRADLLSPHSGYPQGQNEAPETHPEYSAMTLPFESPQTLELIAASERLDMSIRQTQSLGHLSSLLSRPKTLDDYLREARLEAHSDVGPRSHLAHLHVRQAGDSEQQGTLARLYIHRSLVNWYRYQLPDGSFALHPCNSGPIRMEGDSVSLHPADNTQLVLFDAL